MGGAHEGEAVSTIPELQTGDRLTRAEFERRYHAMPQVKKAELIEGVVYMPSPVKQDQHSGPHFDVITWLGVYRAATPGVEGGDNASLRLDLDNEPQPDAFLRILPARGGQSGDDEGYVEGAPELIVEVAASSASYDVHDKLNAYRRSGVSEYIVWRTLDRTVDWLILEEGRYRDLRVTGDGTLRSRVFPGLWLDPAALIARDMGRVLEVVQAGITSEAHQDFVARLSQETGG